MRNLRRPVALGVLLLACVAGAHAPGLLSASRPFEVEDSTISRALYGRFERGDEVFVVRLSFREDFAFPVEVFVPHQAQWREHRPAFALVGPGLPAPTEAERAALPRPLPEGVGAYVDMNQVQPRPVFYETFTRRFFWSTGVVALVVPKGTYEFWIWSPQRTTGKFGLGYGVEERVDFADAIENWSEYAY